MEDVSPPSSPDPPHLPEARHDPANLLRPEIDEENSTPTPPIADPTLDTEAIDEQERQVDEDDDGLSDAESALSEVDEAQFEDFDPANIAIEDRPAIAVDETNVALIGVHKRKRTEGEGDGEGKKKKKRDNRRERSRKSKKRRDEDEQLSGGEEVEGRRRTKRKEGGGRTRGATPEEDNENLTPEERMCALVDVA
jgi:transcription factor SPN1